MAKRDGAARPIYTVLGISPAAIAQFLKQLRTLVAESTLLTSRGNHVTVAQSKGAHLMVPKDGHMTGVENDAHALPLQRFVTFRLTRIQARLNAEASRILRMNGGLSLTQWRIFVMLEAHGEQTATDIIRHTQIDKAQISRAARDMIATGLLTQRVNPIDQRAHLLDFTKLGREAFDRARPHMRARQTRLLDALTPDEIKLFYDVLDKLEAVASPED